jgi:hypothetical protein
LQAFSGVSDASSIDHSMARDVLRSTRCSVFVEALRFEERSMRFLLTMLATLASGLACEKDPALSNTTNHLAPAPAASIVAEKPISTNAAAVPAAIGGISAAASQDAIPRDVARDAVTPAANGAPGVSSAAVVSAADTVGQNGAQNTLGKPVSVPSPGAPEPVAPRDSDGEPMDDVDDEVVPATDKSGVDNVETEEGPLGPVDEDSEGADIDIRE